MTGYAALSSTQIDADSPLIEDTLIKLRDNPLAMFEGAAGAPRLQTAAIETGAVTAGKLKPTVAGSNYAAFYGGAMFSGWKTYYVPLWESRCTVGVAGAFRAKFRIVVPLLTGGTYYAQAYKNSVAIGSEISFSAMLSPYPYAEQDFTLSKGDELYLAVKCSSAGSVFLGVDFGLFAAEPVSHVSGGHLTNVTV